MKYGFFCIFTLALIFCAYQTAQNKLMRPLELSAIRLGMTVKEFQKTFGTPSAKSRNQLTYILDDESELTLTLRDKVISSAVLKFKRLIEIEDPQMRKLTLIQMDEHAENDSPSWFFAGNPAEGLIYKITSEGRIESLTWVPPFTYGNHQPKHLQALLQDFQSKQSSKL